eukprot:scaffold17482_cov52-Attheya_sp.AAC.4
MHHCGYFPDAIEVVDPGGIGPAPRHESLVPYLRLMVVIPVMVVVGGFVMDLVLVDEMVKESFGSFGGMGFGSCASGPCRQDGCVGGYGGLTIGRVQLPHAFQQSLGFGAISSVSRPCKNGSIVGRRSR